MALCSANLRFSKSLVIVEILDDKLDLKFGPLLKFEDDFNPKDLLKLFLLISLFICFSMTTVFFA